MTVCIPTILFQSLLRFARICSYTYKHAHTYAHTQMRDKTNTHLKYGKVHNYTVQYNTYFSSYFDGNCLTDHKPDVVAWYMVSCTSSNRVSAKRTRRDLCFTASWEQDISVYLFSLNACMVIVTSMLWQRTVERANTVSRYRRYM